MSRFGSWVGRNRGWIFGGTAAAMGLGLFLGLDVDVPGAVEEPEPLGLDAGSYVAFGDSYSAGEGLAPYIDGTQDAKGDNNRCHRSARAYGALLGGPDFAESADFAACSGAVIVNVFDEEQHHKDQPVGGVQVEDVSDSPELITITMSGNDVGFADILVHCATHFGCLDDHWVPDSFEESTRHIPEDELTLEAGGRARIADLETQISNLHAELGDLFPQTRILVLGYPRLVPTETSGIGQLRCLTTFRAAFSEAERAGLRALGDELNAAIARASSASDVEYVHVADAFDGHEACGVDGQWIGFGGALNELPSIAGTGAVRPGNFHPTTDGQRMLARLVTCYLAENPEPPTSDTAVGYSGDAVHECAAV